MNTVKQKCSYLHNEKRDSKKSNVFSFQDYKDNLYKCLDNRRFFSLILKKGQSIEKKQVLLYYLVLDYTLNKYWSTEYGFYIFIVLSSCLDNHF